MNKKIIALLIATLLLALPLIIGQFGDFWLHIFIMIGIFSILSMGLNVIIGYAGQFALGHAAFYGIGAYTAALLMLKWEISFWLVLPISAIVTAFFGFILATPVMRLKGDYLGIVTLGFGEIVRLIFVNWVDLTRGPMGLPGIPAPQIFGYSFSGKIEFYYLILALVGITYVIIYRIIHSGIGLNMLTVREDENLASSIGIRPAKYKIMAFTIGAFFAGIAGSFWATYISYVSPDAFRYLDSVNILAMVILGGSGNLVGSILGASILVVAPEILRFVSEYRMLLLGVAIVFMMIFKPQGFWGEKHRKLNFYGKVQKGDKR